MCVNYVPTPRRVLEKDFGMPLESPDWPEETWQDYPAPIIRLGSRGPEAVLASYGLVPQSEVKKMGGIQDMTTMNARAETVATLSNYRDWWRNGQRCLVPMLGFFEPKYLDAVRCERWRIEMSDGTPFAVAGMWRSWPREDGGEAFSFTQITINAAPHQLMNQFHKPHDEKRSLVVVPRADYGKWLRCPSPELARGFLQPYPAELMRAASAPKPPRASKADPRQGELF